MGRPVRVKSGTGHTVLCSTDRPGFGYGFGIRLTKSRHREKCRPPLGRMVGHSENGELSLGGGGLFKTQRCFGFKPTVVPTSR